MIQTCRHTGKPSDSRRPLTPLVCLHNSTLLSGRRDSQGLGNPMKLGRLCKPRHNFVEGLCQGCGIPEQGTTKRDIYNFWRHVEKSDGCWLWLGGIDPDGYGRCTKMFHTHLAHRVAFKLVRGFMPERELDHLCRVRHCVKPSHLEPVEHKENLRRSPLNQHCKRGHLLKGNRFLSGESSRCGVCYQEKLKEARTRRRARGLKKPGRKAVL